jgi:20S proteasome alpha/beta subunit
MDLKMNLLIIGSSILVALGIKGLRALAVNYKYKQTLPKDELIKFTKKVVKGAIENGQGEGVNLPEWEKAIINKINNGEITSIKELEKYIDSSREIFTK